MRAEIEHTSFFCPQKIRKNSKNKKSPNKKMKNIKNFQKTLAKRSSLWYIKYRSCDKHKTQKQNTWLHGQAVKTSPFHGGNTGSIPVGVIWRHSQVVRQRSATPLSPVQIWLAPLIKTSETFVFEVFSMLKYAREAVSGRFCRL